MYNQPYFIPGYYSTMAAPSMMRGAMGGAVNGAMRGAMGSSMLRGAGATANASRGLGIFSRLGSGLSAIRGINWGGFINTASKTLGVVNQTIPLVRQVGPMVNNMKSMLKVASLFKDETDKNPSRRTNLNNSQNTNAYQSSSSFRRETNNNSKKNSEVNYSTSQDSSDVKENSSDVSPTFFIGD